MFLGLSGPDILSNPMKITRAPSMKRRELWGLSKPLLTPERLGQDIRIVERLRFDARKVWR